MVGGCGGGVVLVGLRNWALGLEGGGCVEW